MHVGGAGGRVAVQNVSMPLPVRRSHSCQTHPRWLRRRRLSLPGRQTLQLHAHQDHPRSVPPLLLFSSGEAAEGLCVHFMITHINHILTGTQSERLHNLLLGCETLVENVILASLPHEDLFFFFNSSKELTHQSRCHQISSLNQHFPFFILSLIPPAFLRKCQFFCWHQKSHRCVTVTQMKAL